MIMVKRRADSGQHWSARMMNDDSARPGFANDRFDSNLKSSSTANDAAGPGGGDSDLQVFIFLSSF